MNSDKVIRIASTPPGGLEQSIAPDEAERRDMARELDLRGLPQLEARLRVEPWHDGIEVSGKWQARVEQTCGVTLEPLDSDLSGEFVVRVVPDGSPLAPAEASLADMDPDAEDPPEVSETGDVDLTRLVFEHLALEIDPFPRKPGAVFEAPPELEELSPFAVLKQLHKDI